MLRHPAAIAAADPCFFYRSIRIRRRRLSLSAGLIDFLCRELPGTPLAPAMWRDPADLLVCRNERSHLCHRDDGDGRAAEHPVFLATRYRWERFHRISCSAHMERRVTACSSTSPRVECCAFSRRGCKRNRMSCISAENFGIGLEFLLLSLVFRYCYYCFVVVFCAERVARPKRRPSHRAPRNG